MAQYSPISKYLNLNDILQIHIFLNMTFQGNGLWSDETKTNLFSMFGGKRMRLANR